MPTPQDLKKAFFSQKDSFFGRKSKTYKNHHLKDITAIFSNIASNPTYSEIRKRYKIHHAIKLGLSKTLLGFVVYVAYKDPVLTIMATNHIGQTELNYQKMSLIKHLKRYKDFKNIDTVSILRYDMVKRSLKPQYYDVNKVNTIKKFATYEERSHGIFENNITDKKLHSQIESIRKLIQDNKKG